MDQTTKGTISTIGAFFLWGVLPIYWKALKHVPATQILAHRVVWSLAFVVVLLSLQRRWKEARTTISVYPNARTFLVTSLLFGANTLTFIWAINTNQIVEASLGYFINPLVDVCLGVVFLRERLHRWQTLALILAFFGVLFLTLQYGRVPWIALTLALTFGIYGLIRKTARAESIVGLLYENSILTPFALFYLISLAVEDSGAFGSVGLRTDLLFMGAGVVTAIPFLLFTYGARRIQYSTVGFLHYLSPTCSLLVGVFLYKEPFTHTHAISFASVWLGIIVYSISSFMRYQRQIES